MSKILGSILAILVAVVIVLALAKDAIIKTVMEQAVTGMTGFKTTVESVKYDFPSTIQISGLDIKNPQGFKAKTFVNIPEIFVSLHLSELIKSRKIHLPEVRLNLQEVNIEKNEKGVSNVELLTSVGGKQGQTQAPEQPAQIKKVALLFQLDRLVLTIRNVSYEDRSGLIGSAPIPGKKLAVDLNVQQEVFTNITDPQQLVNVILVKILNSATLGRILNIDPSKLLGDNVNKVLMSGQELVNQQAAVVTKQVGNLANQATSAVGDNQVTQKAEALVHGSLDGAKNVLGDTAGSAKDQVSGLFGKLKALQPGDKTAEKTQ